MISILPKIIKIISAILLKLLRSKKLRFSKPYTAELTVLVSVSMDNLKEFSNVKLSKVNILDKTKIDIINEIKTRNAILTSWSSILISVLNKFLSITFIGLTKR